MNLSIIAAFAYGILAIARGIVGYIQARSRVSLFSGSISGLLLILAAQGDAFTTQGDAKFNLLRINQMV